MRADVGRGLVGTMYNGISLAGVKTGLVEDNFVQAYTDMGTRVIVRDGSIDVAVRGNVISEPVADIHRASGADNVRFVAGSNKTTSGSGVGDTAALDAWLAKRGR